MPRYNSIIDVPPEQLAKFKRKLVLKDSQLLKGTIDVGWRITCTDGHYDRMWGNTKNDESLKNLLTDIEHQYGQVEVLDERKRVTEVKERGE